MERATHPVEERHDAQPIARDADLPTISERSLMLFAAGALVATLVGLLLLL